MVTLDENLLHTFLNERKEKIIKDKIPIDSLISLVTFLFSLLTVEYNKIDILSNNKIIIIIFWALFFIYSFFVIRKCWLIKRHRYSIEKLYSDILSLQKPISEHSLIIIKSNSCSNKDMILLKYDRRWKCYLLPYFKTDSKNNEENIIKKISEQFNISKKDFSIKYIRENTCTKQSVSNERTKTYHHKYYEAKLYANNRVFNKNRIRINRQKYKWFTIDEMQCNQRMMEVNQDVIKIIKEIYK